MIQLGFSTGCFYKSPLTIRERIAIIANAGCRTIELGCVKMESFRLVELAALDANDLLGFENVSFHAPKFGYGKNGETEEMLERIRQLRLKTFFGNAVFHPDQIADFGIFDCVGLSIALENMDNRKMAYKTPAEFESVFAKNENLSLVLDVNHAYTNDPSLQLATRFCEKFGNRIVQVHLSGYSGYHEPLFKMPAEQKKIIKAVRNLDVPIIVESILGPDELVKERDYILKTLQEP
jgi:sugar phosphate isomerase/epimerase